MLGDVVPPMRESSDSQPFTSFQEGDKDPQR